MPSILQRFADQVDIHIEGCWLWTGAVNKGGYGQIKVNGKQEGAHRLSHQLFIGEIPDGKFVLHECDMPMCVRPSHLFLGDHQSNMQDASEKLRKYVGSLNPHAKLSVDQVKFIRTLPGPFHEKRYHEIGELYGVTSVSVKNIVTKRTWKRYA